MPLVMWAALATTAWAVPDAATLRGVWDSYEPALQADAVYPLTFTDDEWADVAAGEVARRRVRLEGTDRVIGLVWADADKETTWLAVQDPHIKITDGFTEELLPGSTFGNKIVYQSIDLPWPLATRQWVIQVINNAALRESTGDRLWERVWAPHPARGAEAERKRGVWLEISDGAWMFADAAGGTLVCYHARTSIGGIVPDDFAVRWSFRKVGQMLEDVAERVDWVREHYVGDHEPVLRPGAIPIRPRQQGPSSQQSPNNEQRSSQ